MLARANLIWKALAVSAMSVASLLLAAQPAQAYNFGCNYDSVHRLYEAGPPCRGKVYLVGGNAYSEVFRLYYYGDTVDWCVKAGQHKFVGMEADFASGTARYMGFGRNDCAGYPRSAG
jgi:hypothetical protein